MRKRAAWRAGPYDPSAGAGWGYGSLLGQARFLSTRFAWMLRIGTVAALDSGRWIFAFVLFALTSVPEGVFDRFDRLSRQGQGPDLAGLTTLPAPATPFPCRVEVGKGDTLLGLDEGIVTFVEGWLVYEGRRTSFSIRRTDVSKRSGGQLELAEGGRLVFRPHDRLTVGEATEADLAKRFRANLATWMRSDAPSGESVLPPTRPHATGIARARGQMTTAVVAGTLVTWALAAHHSAGWAQWAGLSFALGFLFAWRDLNRLRRLMRPAAPPTAVE